MNSEKLVALWFELWEKGDYKSLPLAEDFRHTSPYGVVEGKKEYIELIGAHTEQFLGHRFEILDAIYEAGKACVRYAALKGGFRLEVSEWYYLHNGVIGEIVAYYHLGGNANKELQQGYPK